MSAGDAPCVDLCGSDTEEDEPVEELIASRFFGGDDATEEEEEVEREEEEDSPEHGPAPVATSAAGASSVAAPSSVGVGGVSSRFFGAATPAAGPSSSGGGGDSAFFSSLLAEHGGLVRTDRPFEPMPHQVDAATFCASRSSVYALVHEPGLGKTCTTMLIYAALVRQARQDGRAAGRLLISSPAAVSLHWRKTVLDYLTIRPREVLCTSKAEEVTAAALQAARVIILTRDCLTNIFRKCHAWVDEHHTIPMPSGAGRRWVGGWAARGATPLFAFLAAEGLELMSIDEAHVLRNPKTAWCEAHHRVARAARMRGVCTGTPICNSPRDAAGQMYAVHAGPALDNEKVWLQNGQKGTVSTATARLYRTLQHRVTEEVLRLPPMHRVVREYQVRLPPPAAADYASEWQSMKRLRVQMHAGANGRGALLIALLAKLQKLRQLIVSPTLYAEGAGHARGDAAAAIAASGSGFLDALAELVAEIAPRHARFVIVAESVGILQIGAACARRAAPQLAWHGTYDGSLSQQRRDALVRSFLGCSSGVLGLSLKAGGVGLNLVPGVTAMVMLSQSFSPADTRQALDAAPPALSSDLG